MSVILSFKLDNMVFSEDEKKIFVVPAKTERFKIGELNIAGAGKYKFSYNFKDNYGDATLTRYDTAYAYDLPFAKGKPFQLWQGYNGSFSHQNENALDFTMPEGTEVLAAREGIVIKVVQNNTESCGQKDCAQYNNLVKILHPDGTIATYAHIKYNGAKVKPGDIVKKSDLIAYSGNTGWSSGPHLHFLCNMPTMAGSTSIATKFRLDNGTAAFLEEKKTYTRNY